MLIIDVQRNLTAENGAWILNLEQTDKMIEKINSIIKKSTEKNLIVIYISNEFKKYSIINWMTGRAMEEQTDGVKIDERIAIINNNHFIKNKMDSFTSDDFNEFLKNHEINHLIITGMDAEDCVDKTIKGALNRNYKITVISDAIATKSIEKRDKKIVDFRNLGAEIMTTDDFINNNAEYNQ